MDTKRAILQFPKPSTSQNPPRLNKTSTPNPDNETLEIQNLSVEINNARLKEPAPSLHQEGFQLLSQLTGVLNFDNVKEIQDIYYKEMEDLVKKVTGAEKCILFDHTIRKVAPEAADTSVKASPLVNFGGYATTAVNRVHGDYTANGAPRRVMSLSKGSYTSARELISEEEAKEAVSNRRVLICNVWRNISTFPVKRQPLALLDCSTTKPSEFFTVELVFEDRIGENQGVVPSKDHNWYYFPDMLKDEALIFKTYDSLDDGVTSRFTMHTAFADPSTQSNHPTRESIEVRVVAIMPPK